MVVMFKILSTWSCVLHFIWGCVVLSFMIVVVLCWQQLVQTVQGEFWVRATQEGNQLATNVATVSEKQPLEMQKREVNKKEKGQC